MTAERVERLLAAESADDVAALLREAGAKGRPSSFGSCPVASFIRGGGASWARVGFDFIRYPDGSRLAGVDTPEHVQAFMQKFDNGLAYQELAS